MFCILYATLCFVFFLVFVCFSLQVRDTAETKEMKREFLLRKTTDIQT